MMNYYAIMTVLSTLCGIAGFITHSVAAGVFGCFNGMIFIYNFIVLNSLYDMYEIEYEKAVNVHNDAKASQQVFKKQILNASDLIGNAKVPLVYGKINEV